MITKEQNILRNLLSNEEFARRVTPFLKKEYFEGAEQLVYELFETYFNKFNNRPSVEAMIIELDDRKEVPEKLHENAQSLLTTLKETGAPDDLEWLLENTEKFCKDKSLYLALSKSIAIADGGDKNLSTTAIPDIMSEALSVSFDMDIGHDYLDAAEARYDALTAKVFKIGTDLEYLNKITRGGVEKKTLNVIMAGTNVGKSLGMCHMAANDLREGRNVLYITLEMSEEKIAQRIDANLLGISLDDLDDTPKPIFMEKMAKLREKVKGRLIVKEYPTSGAHVGHIRFLLRELKLKRKFVPDIIYIDYINIMASSRIKLSGDKSYGYVKAITEEVRGLAVEWKVPIWSATQLNRTGYVDSDPDLDSVAESFGLTHTCDFIIAMIETEELEAKNWFLVKQLKNRYAKKSVFKRFFIGVDKDHQRLYDLKKEYAESAFKEGVNAATIATPAANKTSGSSKVGGKKDFSNSGIKV